MFADSLHAALTLDEVRRMIAAIGFDPSTVRATSDRHWTWTAHKPLAAFEDMVKDLDKQKETREQIFSQELSSHKDRGRLLEEKFKEAMKRADKDKDKVYRNPLDLD